MRKRRFFLNIGGNVINLNHKTHYLMNPQGLGLTREQTFATRGGGFFLKTKDDPVQGSFTAEIHFAGRDPYADYNAFINLLAQHQDDLTLIYKPMGKEYRARVSLSFIQKSEIEARRLVCPISFSMTTPWYTQDILTLTQYQPETIENPKRYDYPYEYRYQAEYNDVNQIYSNGHIAAGLVVTVPGELSSPKLILEDLSGKSLGQMTFEGLTVKQNERLIFRSLYGECGVYVNDRDISQYYDFNTDTFFRLPPNTRCRLKISDSSRDSISYQVSVYSYYLSV